MVDGKIGAAAYNLATSEASHQHLGNETQFNVYDSIVSILPHICGNCCSMFSRFDRCEMQAVLVRRAFVSHSWIGCLKESDCMRVVATCKKDFGLESDPWRFK